MAIVLIGLSLRKLHGHMPLVGTNSRAIAAACHVSPLSTSEATDSELGSVDLGTAGAESEVAAAIATKFTITTTTRDMRNEEEMDYQGMTAEVARLTRISRTLLSWGIVPMPDEWYREHQTLTARDTDPSASDAVALTSATGNDGMDCADGPALEASNSSFEVAHLSFGTPLDGVTAPKEGRWYLFG